MALECQHTPHKTPAPQIRDSAMGRVIAQGVTATEFKRKGLSLRTGKSAVTMSSRGKQHSQASPRQCPSMEFSLDNSFVMWRESMGTPDKSRDPTLDLGLADHAQPTPPLHPLPPKTQPPPLPCMVLAGELPMRHIQLYRTYTWWKHFQFLQWALVNSDGGRIFKSPSSNVRFDFGMNANKRLENKHHNPPYIRPWQKPW
jgi:hypothetical protein